MPEKLMAIILSLGLISGIGIVSAGSASATPKPAPVILVPLLLMPSFPSTGGLAGNNLTAQALLSTLTAMAEQAKADLAAGVATKRICKNISKLLSVSGGFGTAAFAFGVVFSGAPPVVAAAGMVSTVASVIAVLSYLSSFLMRC